MANITSSEYRGKALFITVDAVIALVKINGLEQVLTLWQGAVYIAIGNWTQEQANTRILELI